MDLQARPSTDLEITAVRLRQSKRAILELWERRVRERLPAARGQTQLALYDHLPEFLELMAAGLEGGGAQVERSVESVSTIHGELRAGLPEYSIKQVILEYVVLRQCILDVLEEDGNLLSRAARDSMMAGIHEGIVGAAAVFSQSQDQIREQFIAILTHDLKNPLSAIKTCLQLIPRVIHDTDKVQTLATRAAGAVRRIEGMIQDLLDTFQIRAGTPLPLDVRPNDLCQVAKEAVEELSTVHGTRFVLNAPSSMPAEFCSDGIRRSIENLANNAVKYGDPHTPITITVLPQEGQEIALSVHNYGNPLVVEEQAKLFRPFHRAPFAKTSGIKGWGLGLVLVQGVARAHGGRVTVSSSSEDGTTFTIHLPRNQPKRQEAGDARLPRQSA